MPSSTQLSFIDTHCHLDSLTVNPQNPLSELINSASAVGVETIITIGVDPDNLDKVSALTNEFSAVYGSQGIHPHAASHYTDEVEAKIKNNIATNNKLVAIGEIGLDYHYNFSPPEIQRTVFEKQLQLAIDLDLPIILHNRESDDDMMSILNNFFSLLRKSGKGVFHSFSSGKKIWQWALDHDFYLGYNGIITFKKSDELRALAKATPLNRILLETDAPYLAPTPHRGKENTPCFIPLIAKAVADIHQIDLAELSLAVWQNSQLFFNKETFSPSISKK